ncbi:hypothetical protein ANN_01759 [Periplaneta americana]|uniref:Uncharacterized protein n=1 Tax=Periplaneta americana TaxID=6978 RepID=A0ABQ8TUG4_PERAM|nr:hypothetical protein ANN_01759 [Periplaneta americana]
MAPVRHRWSINDVIGGIQNTVMPSDCSPVEAPCEAGLNIQRKNCSGTAYRSRDSSGALLAHLSCVDIKAYARCCQTHCGVRLRTAVCISAALVAYHILKYYRRKFCDGTVKMFTIFRLFRIHEGKERSQVCPSISVSITNELDGLFWKLYSVLQYFVGKRYEKGINMLVIIAVSVSIIPSVKSERTERHYGILGLGLEVNPEKTKYMIMSRDQNIVRNGNIKIRHLSFEEVEKFKYS